MKLIHLSDIHVWSYTWNPSRLMGRRLFRTIDLMRGRAKRFELARLEAVVDRVLSLSPDHVLITGDLTTTALPIEFQAAKRQLGPLLHDPSRVSILPGNHDRSTWYSAHVRRFEMAFGEFMPSPAFPWMRHLDEQTAILGLDPTRPRISPTGRLPEAQLAAAEALTSEPASCPRRLVVACHYPVDAPPDYALELLKKRMKNDDEVRAWLARLGPHLYCCGHVHAAWAFRPPTLPRELCLNSGAPLMTDPTGKRMPGFLEINLENDSVEVLHQAWDGNEWSVVPMFHEPAFFSDTAAVPALERAAH